MKEPMLEQTRSLSIVNYPSLPEDILNMFSRLLWALFLHLEKWKLIHKILGPSHLFPIATRESFSLLRKYEPVGRHGAAFCLLSPWSPQIPRCLNLKCHVQWQQKGKFVDVVVLCQFSSVYLSSWWLKLRPASPCATQGVPDSQVAHQCRGSTTHMIIVRFVCG